MDQEQRKAATAAMVEWLEHPQEFGKKPARIECAGMFEAYDMCYYIFKFKKTVLGKWMLGVCGGYEEGSLDHCGHVYSEMEPYDEGTAEEKARALVEYVRNYFMELGQRAEKEKESAGSFVNFVLLSEERWDKEAFLAQMKSDWQIEDEHPAGEDAPDGDDDEGEEISDDVAMISYNGAMIIVSFFPAAIPNGEAEYAAERNNRWPEAKVQAAKHRAHLVAAVMGRMGNVPPKEAGVLLVKTISCCLRQPGALGVYANGVVYQPEFYLDFVGLMQKGMFPLFNLVWFGVYRGQRGINAYTSGMRSLGYDEIEIIDSSAPVDDVANLLTDIAEYVVDQNVILRDGVKRHIMAKANIKLLLSFFDPFLHIISEITRFPSHYSYELSIQLQTVLSFQ